MATAMVEEAVRQYFARETSRWKDKDARAFGPEFDRLHQQTVYQIHETVRENPEQYPEIHRRLTWDDAKAGVRWRECEIKDMRNSYEVSFVGREGISERSRGSYQVPVTVVHPGDERKQRDGRTAAYVGVSPESVLENPEIGEWLLNEAISALIAFRNRFGKIRSFLAARVPEMDSLFDLAERLDQMRKDEKQGVRSLDEIEATIVAAD